MRRKWTAEQKLAIVQETQSDRVLVVARRHGIAAPQLYRWIEEHAAGGEQGLRQRGYREDPELRRLRLENQQLKELLADKELALRIKDSLLKKTEQRTRSEL